MKSRNAIVVIGSGPAGAITAALLRRYGYDVTVVGRVRSQPCWEGMSIRALDGLANAGLTLNLRTDLTAARRYSWWNGSLNLVNVEYLVERRQMDLALQRALTARGVNVVDGYVTHHSVQDGGCVVAVEGKCGRVSELFANFLVIAHGRRGGKHIVIDQMPVSVMLGRLFSARLGKEAFTVTESFEDGWGWATWNGDGKLNVNITMDGDLAGSADCEYLFTTYAQRSPEISKLITSGAVPLTQVTARGSRPNLNADLISSTHIRVGDAAYTVDPLSGNGMYEAVSGGYAAVPVINTLLQKRADSLIAMQYYQDRARAIFRQRLDAGADIYKRESRWNSDFWRKRAINGGQAFGTTTTVDRGSFISQPVVEDGFILSRDVFISAAHPRGIRFVNGIDLAVLHKTVLANGSADIAMLTTQLSKGVKDITAALSLLVQNGLYENGLNS
ncbi:tryptophan 7-halogenase [Noviherbaspirillum sp. CPCC 100848]|uniref:Tryptophan 7-halogenase n=1 Tax=Noviherbaspirillum album TaxID=3080276 RepID=A0ABU6JGL7_9BURK|nr:tryptophan 7-halogenase [Noviherbaspirillum sp. CPCC 100848]MEC4722813.1 tryptophan 7-halogenase [Noviherbaspirillum sp. CPCC 100848]